MRSIGQLYDLLIRGLFCLSGVYVCGIVVSVIWDVAARNFHFFAPIWLDTFAGYGLLIITLASAPTLVRHRWHVTMDLLETLVPVTWLPWWQRAVDVAAALLSGLLGGFALYSGYLSWLHNEMDVQSIDIPRWIAFAIIGVGLLLSAVEFIRHLFGLPPPPVADSAQNRGAAP
jgi:TRAP-type C4-dicarboxylate transport system permease small subunit